jgi:hypothetical protein
MLILEMIEEGLRRGKWTLGRFERAQTLCSPARKVRGSEVCHLSGEAEKGEVSDDV